MTKGIISTMKVVEIIVVAMERDNVIAKVTKLEVDLAAVRTKSEEKGRKLASLEKKTAEDHKVLEKKKKKLAEEKKKLETSLREAAGVTP
jgi:vacuolar-type H+-ATPase subunit I/STV1